jgi:hypothetical protein
MSYIDSLNVKYPDNSIENVLVDGSEIAPVLLTIIPNATGVTIKSSKPISVQDWEKVKVSFNTINQMSIAEPQELKIEKPVTHLVLGIRQHNNFGETDFKDWHKFI